MSQTFTPNSSGYICHWLVTEPKEELYYPDFFLSNQLQFEKKLREQIADDALQAPPSEIVLGQPAFEGYKWQYYNAGNNWFLDLSKFYHSLTKVEYWAATRLVADVPRSVSARVWTYEAVDLRLNGEKIVSIKEPVYKPIRWADVTLALKAGENELFARLQDLGVRDTRNIFGIQLLGDISGLTVSLPDPEHSLKLAEAEAWLLGVTLQNNCFTAQTPPPAPVQVDTACWENGTQFAYDSEGAVVRLSLTLEGQTLTREIEQPEKAPPVVTRAANRDEAVKNAIAALLEKLDPARSKGNMNAILLHYYCGVQSEADFENLHGILHRIDIREDCADFLLSGVIRLVAGYKDKIPADEMARIKETILNFRYWMEEDGADGMCFWSENHALLFHFCQLGAGYLYPDETFVRSGRTGREQYALALSRCREWLDSVGSTGFEEFLSPGYMCVTAAALMGVIDFADDETSAMAAKVMDREFEMLAMHTFDGVLIGPRGRIYRDVVHPHQQEIQGFLKYIDDSAADNASPWLCAILTSKYHFKDELLPLIAQPQDVTYPNGNTEISLYKTKDCILSSVASPRSESFTGGWTNETASKQDPYADGNFTYMYVKALNERYHGTTKFEPGVFGYQQHLWSAALSNVCHVFTNLPGGTFDASAMRPGYWYGNGLFPAVKQEHSKIGVIYRIEDTYPVKFTHLYWPEDTFDATETEGGWRFGRCQTGYVGVWCSGVLTPHNDKLMRSEQRCYDADQAYVCRVSGEQEQSYEAFKAACLASTPAFDPATMTLTDAEGYSLRWEKHTNNTQVI